MTQFEYASITKLIIWRLCVISVAWQSRSKYCWFCCWCGKLLHIVLFHFVCDNEFKPFLGSPWRLVINDAKIAHIIFSHVRLTSFSFHSISDKIPRNNPNSANVSIEATEKCRKVKFYTMFCLSFSSYSWAKAMLSLKQCHSLWAHVMRKSYT